MAKYLVIVESPAKVKTIKKFLGKNYEVVASNGHVRDLPKSQMGIDVEHDYEPKYITIRGKGDLLASLRKEVKKAEKIYLATDPDMEGEAISWHLAHILKMDANSPCRIVFNEITSNTVKKSVKEPRAINMDLVDAQQARRVLDRLVGYKISPILWAKVRRGLSAGRVQSVAVSIICDREQEINDFVPEEYWNITAKLKVQGNRKPLEAKFYGMDGKKLDVHDEKTANDIIARSGNEFTVSDVKTSEKSRHAPAPFTTSSMQQEAARKLGFTTKLTMLIAQQLYEGVEIHGKGTTGLITYIRTDSVRIADEAQKAALEYISDTYGKDYVPKKPNIYKGRKGAQDAHEAIRPADIRLTPQEAKASLNASQYKLYKLIWERFLACQMAQCLQSTTQADITGNGYVFKASGYTVTFDGFTVLYVEGRDEAQEDEGALPPLEKDMTVRAKEIVPNQHFTQPPPRYTEASLIKAMEEYGIGRPSTYAATITTITGREYVVRDGKALKPTELGEVTTKLMKERFPKIVNVKFTAQMEEDLDGIEAGKENWVDTLEEFYGDFDKTLQKAKEEMKDVKITLEEDKTDLICEKCGRQMVVKVGRYGKFIACPGYPECKNIKKFVKETGAECPKCGGRVIEKKTKKGRVFYGCDHYPECDFVSWDEPIQEKCPKCGKTLLKKKGKKPKIYCVTEGCGYERVEDQDEN